MAGLEIQIGADNSDLNKKIKEAELNLKELSNIKLEQIKLGLDTKEINGNIASVKKSLTELKTVSKDTGNAISGMAPKVANGGNALMQFSRIAQDAPFGIMGIGNNITATVEAFGHLKQSTGSTGSALKAVASSMLGSGGILLAVSLVTTGLTYMSQNGITVGDVFRRLTGDFDEYASALKKVNNAAYEDKGVQEAVSNVNELGINIRLAKDGFLDKEAVVKQYNETIGKTTGLVSSLDEAEKELTRNGDAYIKMTLYKAAANFALEEAAKATLLAEKSRQKSLKEFTNAFLDADLTQTRSKEQYEAKQQNLKKQAENRQKEEIKINAEAAKRNLDIAKKFQEDAAKIAKNFNFNLFGDTAAPKAGKKEKAKEVKAPIIDFKGSLLNPSDIIDEQTIKVFTGALDKFKQPIKELPGIFKTSMADSKMAFDMGTADLIETMLEFSNSANQLIQGALTESFSSLGSMIGNSMAGADGGLEDAGKNILGVLGNFMTQFGELMIKTGIGLVIAKKMLTSGNGYAMIAGGVALVAIGSAFAAKSKAMQKSGGDSIGGGGNTGGSYSSPASSSSYSSSGGGNFGGGTVVFEIEGSKLVGVLNNTLDKNKRLGGN